MGKLMILASMLIGGLALTACSTPKGDLNSTIDIPIQATSGSHVSGDIELVQKGRDVILKTNIKGLKPGSVHGIHIHEKGDCSAADASSAGGHFAPDHNSHGAPVAQEHHAGDLGNFTADASGTSDIVITAKNVNLDSKSKYSILNRAIVIHEKKDDLISQPSGAAGKRVACAVIH